MGSARDTGNMAVAPGEAATLSVRLEVGLLRRRFERR